MMGNRFLALGVSAALLSGCSEALGSSAEDLNEYERSLQEAYATRPEGSDDAAALFKDGPAGRAWLATIHGYPNNLEVCEELIAPYNSDQTMSDLPGTYRCRYVQHVLQP